MRSLSGGNEQEEGEMKNFRFVRKRKNAERLHLHVCWFISRRGVCFFWWHTCRSADNGSPFIKASMSADTEPITQMVASNTPGPLFMEVLFFLLLLICYLRADNSSNSRRSGFLPASSLNGCSDEAANLIKGVDQDSLHSKSQSEGKRRGSWLM